MKLELVQSLRQEQILAPQMILSMDILLLSNMELENRIQEEFISNPAVEIAESDPEKVDPGTPAQPAPEAGDLARQEADVFEQLEAFQNLPAFGGYDHYPRRMGSLSSDEKLEALANIAGKPEGLREYLIQQVHLQKIPTRIMEVAENIVNNLDSRGYLLAPGVEIYQSLGPNFCTEDEFKQALEVVRGLDPAGVGAENLQECLILQLGRDQQEYTLEIEIIQNHLENLRQNKLPKIASQLGCTVEDIKEAIEIISALQPTPGSAYDYNPPIYLRPEVTVENVEGQFEVKVDNDSLPRVQISESCRRLLKEARGDPEVISFIRKKIESAQWLIQAVRQRQRTIYDIAKAITEYQSEFMEHGPMRLRAMKMQTIADIVGVHISTISRAIKGKYMQTPWGTFEMRSFFTGGVERADGEIESRRNIYREISALIEAENKSEPLSDSQITRLLREKGLAIARRTVTKYREQEGIPSSRLRKQY